jgi:hypothetical protein
MFCKECGTEIPEGSKYCPECGARLAESPPKQEGGIGCYACGQTAVGQCPECGRFYCREHGEEGLCALCAAERLRGLARKAGAWGAFAGLVMGMCIGMQIWEGTDNFINAQFIMGGLGAIVGGYLAFRYASRFGILGIAIASLALAFGSCWTWYWPGSVIHDIELYGRSEAWAKRKIWTTLPVGWGIIILIVGGSLWLSRRREKYSLNEQRLIQGDVEDADNNH